MIDLNTAALPQLPADVLRFTYDRKTIHPGIVHLSVGNFHRAHQAWYLDRLLALPGNEDWGIFGVGIIDDRTERLKLAAFPPQDDLYTLTLYAPDGEIRHHVIGSIIGYLFAPADPESVLARLSDPETRIVSMTITEGGYNQSPKTGAYNLDEPDTKAEIAEPGKPRTAFGFIVEALRRRRDAGTAPFTVMSCDNLRGNGDVTRRSVLSHAQALDAELATWIEARVTFPSCMVDRITPAVLKEDAERVNAECGVHDRLPVIAETFAQWVIEDRFCNGRPPFEQVGAQMVADVHPYELAKVRMLNASHSVLSYPGIIAGLSSVKEAVDHPLLHRLVYDFMSEDAMAVLEAPPDVDLEAYRDKILERFDNPQIGDGLPRICADGASKLPTFLMPTLAERRQQGGETRRIAFVTACFLRYLTGQGDDGASIRPFEPHLTETQRHDAADAIKALTTLPVFADLDFAPDDPFVKTVADYMDAISSRGTLPVLEALLAALDPST